MSARRSRQHKAPQRWHANKRNSRENARWRLQSRLAEQLIQGTAPMERFPSKRDFRAVVDLIHYHHAIGVIPGSLQASIQRNIDSWARP